VSKLALHFRFFRAAVIYFVIGGLLGFLFSIPQVHEFTQQTSIVSGHIILVFFGWVTLTIMGAMSKMVPTMLGKDLYSQEWGEVTYWLMNIGVIGYATLLILEGFFQRAYNIVFPESVKYLNALFISFLIVGAFFFAYNFYKTAGSKTGKPLEPSIGLSLKFYRMSVAYFLASLVLATLYVLGLTQGVLAPLQFAIVLWVAPFTTLGWMTLTIMGAMYHLLPMFTISKVPNFKLAEFQFWALNIGIAFTGVSGLFGAKRIIFEGVPITPLSLLQTIGVIFAGLGALLFVYIMAWTVVVRKRKELNISMKFYLAALLYFTLTAVFGVWLKTQTGFEFAEGNTILLGHGLLSVIGFVSLTIMGSMYSIIPMLSVVDLHEKKKKVPSVLTEMYNEKVARLSFWVSTVGVAGYVVGLVAEGYVTALMPQGLEVVAFPYQMISIIFVAVLMVGIFLFVYNIQKMYSWFKD